MWFRVLALNPHSACTVLSQVSKFSASEVIGCELDPVWASKNPKVLYQLVGEHLCLYSAVERKVLMACANLQCSDLAS